MDGMGLGLGWMDLCVGLLYEHRFAVLIRASLNPGGGGCTSHELSKTINCVRISPIKDTQVGYISQKYTLGEIPFGKIHSKRIHSGKYREFATYPQNRGQKWAKIFFDFPPIFFHQLFFADFSTK